MVLEALEQEPLGEGVCLAYLGENFQCLPEWLATAEVAIIVMPTWSGGHPGTFMTLDLDSFFALAGSDDSFPPYPRSLAACLALLRLGGLIPPDVRVMLAEVFEIADRVGLSRPMYQTARKVVATIVQSLASLRAVCPRESRMSRLYRMRVPAGTF
jgi:hypothetical protein